MFWTYTRNRSPLVEETSYELALDAGGTLRLEVGHAYDLTPGEVARARASIELEPGRGPINFERPDAPTSYPPYVPSPGGAGGGRESESFYQPPPLVAGVGRNPFSPVSRRTILGVKGVASDVLSGTIAFDVNRNGATILSSQASIPAGAKHSAVVVPAVTVLEPDDELTVDLDDLDPADSDKSLLVVVELSS
jgi:hypothetical protein